MPTSVFLSVGTPANPQQEAFVDAVRSFLKQHDLAPRTPGQDEFVNTQPLYAVERCMKDCSGAVVVAYQRTVITEGVERPGGPREATLKQTSLPTVWNHIEGAMAYALGLPLLVIAESGLRAEALLEDRYDWSVQWVSLTPAALMSPASLGAFKDWKKRVASRAAVPAPASGPPRRISENTTIGELLKGLTPKQVWGVLGALGTAFLATAGVAYRAGNATRSAVSVEAKPAAAEERWATDSSIALFLGDRVSVAARGVSDAGDSAVLIIRAAGAAADSVGMKQGAAHSFTLSGHDYRMHVMDVRGGDGRPGSVKLRVVPVE